MYSRDSGSDITSMECVGSSHVSFIMRRVFSSLFVGFDFFQLCILGTWSYRYMLQNKRNPNFFIKLIYQFSKFISFNKENLCATKVFQKWRDFILVRNI